MKKLIFVFLASCSLAFAAIDSLEREIDNRVESINARKGIEIGGTVRSASFNSYFESSNEKPAVASSVYTNRMPSHEISEFVQVDLDFKFRPYDIIGANLKLRLGAGMQEYFAAAATVVNVPWLNVEGNYNENFYWVVGDFRQSYSPLTLYMPGLDIMYEPTIFARKREMAQKEALLEGNQRNLQGFNLQFRPQLGEALGELRIEALGARLRRAGYLDASGAMGNMLPNEGIPGATQAGRFDKFLLAGNIELLPLNKNLLAGATYLEIFDDKNSSKYYPSSNLPLNQFDRDYLVNTLDSLPQKTSIFAGRAGADVAGILGNSSLIANLTGEFAMSNDKVYTPFNILDEDNNVIGQEHNSKKESGKAILAQLDVGYKSDVNVLLSSSFIRNDSSWFNNMAQTPSFFASRVLNSDKDVGCIVGTQVANTDGGPCTDPSFNLSKYGVYSPLYSTFDALYFFTPKHSPMHGTLRPGETQSNAQTQSYNATPYAKTSWTGSTLTRAELALLEELSDLNLQMALPNGFATSNRLGFQEVLTVNWKGLAEAKGLFANYEQLSAKYEKGARVAEAAKYMEYGGGAMVNALGILGFERNPMEFSGSYKRSEKEQEWYLGTAKFTSDFINAGLYYRFFRKFGLTFGYQQINSDLNTEAAMVQKEQLGSLGLNVKEGSTWKPLTIIPVVKSTQNQWMAGLDYTIARHAWLAINYGIMSVENTYELKYGEESFVDEQGVIDNSKKTNLAGYLVATGIEPGKTELKHKFSRSILEATINVEF